MTKTEEKKTPVVAAATPAVKAEPAKAAAPAAEPAKKAPAKKAAAKKPAAKKAAAPKAAAKKAPAKKAAAAKKPAAPKAAAKATVVVQFNGAEWAMADVKAKVLAAAGKKTAKDIQIYVKPEEYKAYFVVDGKDGAVDL